MDKILAALGLAKGTNEDGVIAAINALLTSSTAIARAAGLTDAAKPADVLTAVNALAADRTKFAKAAGLKDDAKADEIVTAVQSAVGGAVDPSKYVPIAQVTALQNDMKALRDELTGDKVTEAVNSAIEAGKLAPALKDWGTDYAKRDLKGFQTFVGSSPVLTGTQLGNKKRQGEAGDELSDADLAICSATGIDPKKFAETRKLEKDAR